jgi:hypothetical protein
MKAQDRVRNVMPASTLVAFGESTLRRGPNRRNGVDPGRWRGLIADAADTEELEPATPCIGFRRCAAQLGFFRAPALRNDGAGLRPEGLSRPCARLRAGVLRGEVPSVREPGFGGRSDRRDARESHLAPRLPSGSR